MTSRLKNLSVVARYWGDGDIKVSKESLELSFVTSKIKVQWNLDLTNLYLMKSSI